VRDGEFRIKLWSLLLDDSLSTLEFFDFWLFGRGCLLLLFLPLAKFLFEGELGFLGRPSSKFDCLFKEWVSGHLNR